MTIRIPAYLFNKSHRKREICPLLCLRGISFAWIL